MADTTSEKAKPNIQAVGGHEETQMPHKTSALKFPLILLVASLFLAAGYLSYNATNLPPLVSRLIKPTPPPLPSFTHLRHHCSNVAPISPAEYIQRQDALANTLASLGASAFITEPGASAAYYANISSSSWQKSERPLLAVISPIYHTSALTGETVAKAKLTIVTPQFEATRAKERLMIPSESEIDFVEWAEEEDPYVILSAALRKPDTEHGQETSVVIDDAMRYFVVEGMQNAGVSILGFPPEVRQIRERKTATELAILRCANEVTLQAIREVRKQMFIGMRESQALLWIRTALGDAGLDDPWALTLFGENAALPHGTGTDRVLGRHDLIIFDVGGSLHGYSSDVTRTFALPDSAIPSRHLEIWFTVQKAQRVAIEAVKAGARASDIDAAARNTIKSEGYRAYFTHRLGHGIGLEMHESPYLRGGNDVMLLPGNTCSDEPGIYIEGQVGVRLEDCFVVDENGTGAFLTKGAGGPARSPWLP